MWHLATSAAPMRQQNGFHSCVGVLLCQQACRWGGLVTLDTLLPPPLDPHILFSPYVRTLSRFPHVKEGGGAKARLGFLIRRGRWEQPVRLIQPNCARPTLPPH